MDNKVNILGVGVSNLTVQELNEELLTIIKQGNKEIVLHVNIHGLNLAYRLPWLKELMNATRIVFCDGDGVRLGAAMLGKSIKEKITYNRWIWNFARYSEAHNISWYLIGSKGPVINDAVKKLRSEFPQLALKGYRDGFFKDAIDVKNTIKDINEKSVNVVILGMGMPVQEKWLLDNWKDIDANVALTGGAVFDYVSGSARMTPDYVYRLKLEWFYRFLQEPRRLFKRYIIGNPLFFKRVLVSIIKKTYN